MHPMEMAWRMEQVAEKQWAAGGKKDQSTFVTRQCENFRVVALLGKDFPNGCVVVDVLRTQQQ